MSGVAGHRGLLRWLLPPAAVLLLTPVALVGALATGFGQLPDRAGPSQLARTDIPADLLALYQRSAAGCPGLSWAVLAGVGKLESDHNRPPGQVSSAGAQGPMQFLPGTWVQAGVDGNNDGVADPFEPADAIAAAASYLCSLGADRDTPTAVAAYTCGAVVVCRVGALAAGGYATRVLGWATRYANAVDAGGPAADVAVQVALREVGARYVWGGENPGSGFDCSGLVQFAYARAGVQLPRIAQTQHDAGPALPSGTDPAAGDLVFFGADTVNVTHVGIALGQGRMVDAPHTGALVRVEPIAGFGHYLGATRPATTAAGAAPSGTPS